MIVTGSKIWRTASLHTSRGLPPYFAFKSPLLFLPSREWVYVVQHRTGDGLMAYYAALAHDDAGGNMFSLPRLSAPQRALQAKKTAFFPQAAASLSTSIRRQISPAEWLSCVLGESSHLS